MVKVYFHGRPAGQDFWPAENQIGSDLIYLKSFLDYKVGTKESSVMIIDQISGNSYYTYLHRRNFFEKGGRPDSYCAITVCFEKKICKNTITLYNLLEQAYSLLAKNNILVQNPKDERFLINSYSEKADIFKRCADIIEANWSRIDTVDITSNSDTRKTSGTLYSLKEVDSELFREDAKKTKIIISPDYQPRFTNLEIQNAELKQQLVQIEQKHAKALEEKEKAHREEIARYNNLLAKKDATIFDLNNKIKVAEAKIAELEKLIGNSPIAKKWNELKPEIEKFVGLWTQKFQIKKGDNSTKPTMLSISKIVTYTNTLLLVVILILSLNKCEASASVDIPEDDSNPTESVVENQTTQSQQTETSETEEYTTTENLDNESVKTYTINIVGYNGSGTLKPQMQYILNLNDSGVGYSCEFYFERAPSGTKIEGNRLITGLEGGEIVIYGKGDGFNVEPRTLVIGDVNINKNRTVIKNGKQTIMTDGNRTVITDENGDVTIDTELGTGNSSTSSSEQ